MNELSSVVLTGLGAITARGDWTLHGPPLVASLNDAAVDETQRGIAIAEFKLENYLSSAKTYLDRCSALALAGCALALGDAGAAFPIGEAEADGFGITLGTHLGCLETMKGFWDKAMERGVRLANPLLFSHSYFNSPISLCAIEFGLRGYHATFCAGPNSGLEAAKAAFDAIRLGHVEAMLCGGVEALTATREKCEPAPDAPLGEAAVFLVMENRDHAVRRGVENALLVDDSFFHLDGAQMEANRHVFGDCGGAGAILHLAQHVMDKHG